MPVVMTQWTCCLSPSFTKYRAVCKRPINTQSETANTSGMFRGSLRARRCIVPADAFYEWMAVLNEKQL
jgi:putative SOS response-associated peptidase YedK